MEVVGLKGWLKIKRRSFWSYRYANIDDWRFQYSKNPNDILRGWVDLRDCQISIKKVFPNEKVIAIRRLKGSAESNNKLRKAKEYQLKLADDSQTLEWYNQINRMVQQAGHKQQQDIIINDKVLNEQGSPSKSNKGSNVDQLKDYLDLNNLECDQQAIRNQVVVVEKIMEQNSVQDRKLVEIYGNVNVYGCQDVKQPIIDRYRIQLVAMLVVLNLSLIAMNGFVIYFQGPIFMTVFYLLNFRKPQKMVKQVQMEIGIKCNVNEIAYVINDSNQLAKWKRNIKGVKKEGKRITEYWNNGETVQYCQTIFQYNSNMVCINWIDKPSKVYQIQLNLANFNQQQNVLKMMVFQQLDQQQLEQLVSEMQGLKNYIEIERHQQMNVLNQYCIQQKYINILDNESDDDQSVNSSIFRSNVAIPVSQQYPDLSNNQKIMIDEQDEFQSDKGSQQEVQQQQMIDQLLQESEHGRNLLLLRSSMAELKQLRSKEYLLVNGYSLFTESNGIQIYNKMENSVNHIVSNGIMKFKRQDILDCIGPYDIKQQVDKMFDSGEVIDYYVPDSQKSLFEGFSYAHQKFKGIFPVQGRDFVIGILQETQEKGTYIVSKSVELKECGEKKGYTRGEVILAGWILEDIDGGTQAYYVSNANPKGSIPNKLKQMMTKKQGMTIDNYGKYLESKK